jgi:putative FmdB family regulatory protein
MPIYEFYCDRCNTIFSFLSRSINTTGRPACPTCGRPKLDRQVSAFAATGRAKEDGGDDGLPVDDARMEQAMETLAGEAERMNEDDPKQAAGLMRRLSQMTGMELGPGMKEALKRLEAGEDPDAIEADLGDRIEAEEPFLAPGGKGKGGTRRPPPRRDAKLYEM